MINAISTQSNKESYLSISPKIAQKDVYVYMLLKVAQCIHEVTIDAWHRFEETQQDLSQRNKIETERRRKKTVLVDAMRLEAERRNQTQLMEFKA